MVIDQTASPWSTTSLGLALFLILYLTALSDYDRNWRIKWAATPTPRHTLPSTLPKIPLPLLLPFIPLPVAIALAKFLWRLFRFFSFISVDWFRAVSRSGVQWLGVGLTYLVQFTIWTYRVVLGQIVRLWLMRTIETTAIWLYYTGGPQVVYYSRTARQSVRHFALAAWPHVTRTAVNVIEMQMTLYKTVLRPTASALIRTGTLVGQHLTRLAHIAIYCARAVLFTIYHDIHSIIAFGQLVAAWVSCAVIQPLTALVVPRAQQLRHWVLTWAYPRLSAMASHFVQLLRLAFHRSHDILFLTTQRLGVLYQTIWACCQPWLIQLSLAMQGIQTQLGQVLVAIGLHFHYGYGRLHRAWSQLLDQVTAGIVAIHPYYMYTVFIIRSYVWVTWAYLDQYIWEPAQRYLVPGLVYALVIVHAWGQYLVQLIWPSLLWAGAAAQRMLSTATDTLSIAISFVVVSIVRLQTLLAPITEWAFNLLWAAFCLAQNWWTQTGQPWVQASWAYIETTVVAIGGMVGNQATVLWCQYEPLLVAFQQQLLVALDQFSQALGNTMLEWSKDTLATPSG
ncbi:hypothetical protein H4R33_004023 [Dimargaris cristalligena]|uniref:Uncharacterized protein n=1 Tax=Dimargaris cristalligena TaxID=215637 RepID=A0A4P9ZTS6_9FUNG|nr:hypothetical protein H4R33_004023 [Dimargaris cristalligena]RKP36251.1 hypothetical protein BJ085DRAFT_41122 [Dimargaris cristalligena]|eukprot:RKP36251.1 hypothetical protein BJ085DRAFT_41122 [Dimargaris cristalligena]